ncbi:sensor histidine kinase [Croceicoccus pelagius]|uniref:sensor histidine kinase n=1 Tax=Croceicoccus pelagius TaxID=1703341 RepID=UPI00082966CD|nr:histidine kinase [Croceicoccus pelagius]
MANGTAQVLIAKPSRITALARITLASTFLLAIYVDPSQPSAAPDSTYFILALYVVTAALFLALTWNSWARDQRLALPSHTIDLAVFAIVVLTTDGYTSPFFTFSVFLLLSASLRWGGWGTIWTAIAVNAIFLVAGAISSVLFEITPDAQRVLVRSVYLAVLSLLFIFYTLGRTEGGTLGRLQATLAETAGPSGIMAAIQAEARIRTRSTTGWSSFRDRDEPGEIFVLIGAGQARSTTNGPLFKFDRQPETAFLFDTRTGDAMSSRDTKPRKLISTLERAQIEAVLNDPEGLVIPVSTPGFEGMVVVTGNGNFSTRDLKVGAMLAELAENLLQRWVLSENGREASANRVRLSLARDVHDSVAQILAGLSFRLEALRRMEEDPNLRTAIGELQGELSQEQGRLKTLISALRQPRIERDRADLRPSIAALAEQLETQWRISCVLEPGPAIVASSMIEEELLHMVREAVGNAVRHGRAKTVSITLGMDDGILRMDLCDDGQGTAGAEGFEPVSLRERVSGLKGHLDVRSSAEGTCLSIVLPDPQAGGAS